MHHSLKTRRTVLWATRALSAIVLVFGLPFYFGYGNPLPFLQPEYTAWDNLWLSVFPVMFLGLLLGWKYPRVGGWMVVLSVGAGLIGGFVLEREVVWFMLVPVLVGVGWILQGWAEFERQK